MGESTSEVYAQSWEHMRHVESERYWFLTVYQAASLAIIGAVLKALESALDPLKLLIAEFGLFASASLSFLGLLAAISLRAAYTSHLRAVKRIHFQNAEIRPYYPYWMGDEPWADAGFVDLPHGFAKLGTSFHGVHVSIFRSVILVALTLMSLLPPILSLPIGDPDPDLRLLASGASSISLTAIFYCLLFHHVRRGSERSVRLLRDFLERFCVSEGEPIPRELCAELEGIAESLSKLPAKKRFGFTLFSGSLLADAALWGMCSHPCSVLGPIGFLAGQAISLWSIALLLNKYLRAADDVDRVYSRRFAVERPLPEKSQAGGEAPL